MSILSTRPTHPFTSGRPGRTRPVSPLLCIDSLSRRALVPVLGYLAFGFALSATACGSRSVQGTDSNTHWLSACNEARDCGSDFACVCGSCTKTCDSDIACSALDARDGMCVESVCGGSATAGSCSLACNDDDDCPATLSCSAGSCLLRLACEPGTSCSLDACEGGDCETSFPEAGPGEPSPEASATSNVTDPSEPAPSSTTSTEASTTQTTTATDTTQMPTDTSTAGDELCPAMDALSSADACWSYDGAAWNGSSCQVISCGCVGSDCDKLYETVEQCENARAACVGTVPMCEDIGFALEDLGSTYQPEYPRYHFSAVADDTGLEADGGINQSDAGIPISFDDWTPATWGGWLSLPTIPGDCPGIRGNDDAQCPFASRLHLIAGEGDVYIDVVYLWEGFEQYYVPTEVEFRIDSGRELEVREASTLQPVLFVGQNSSGQVESWQFPPLHVRVGSPACKAQDELCNWLFAASELLVGIGAFNGSSTEPFQLGMTPETAVGLYESRNMEVSFSETETATYEVGQSVSFSGNFPALGDESCGAELPRHDGFFIHRLK